MRALIYSQNLNIGCDPEFFFEKKGKIIGAEKVLDEQGLLDNLDVAFGQKKKPIVIIDGVQAELNPTQNNCRQSLASNITHCFIELHKKISSDKDLSLQFNSVKEISAEELDSLSEKSKKFGCAPSKNIDNKEHKITVNPTEYKTRACGGHIHLGYYSENDTIHQTLKHPKDIVPLLDLLVGNTAVLMDRDMGNIERRKLYGRAGEYRTPDHGVEYRTLSNFWLRAYPLASWAWGMSRMCVLLANQSTPKNNYIKEFLGKVKRDDVVKAINNNDFDLAYKNFKKIEDLLYKVTANKGGFPMIEGFKDEFHYFIEKGLDYWFKEEPMAHWMGLADSGTTGWERFMENVVRADLNKKNEGK